MTTDSIAIWAEAPGRAGEFVMGDTARPSGLPWHHAPDDLRHFRELTRDRVLVMGRKTYEALPAILKSRESTRERPLVVLTSDPHSVHDKTSGLQIQGIPWVATPGIASDLLFEAPRWFDKPAGVAVIGGRSVIELFGPVVDRLVVSRVRGRYPQADVPAPSAGAFDGFRSVSTSVLDFGTIVTTFERNTK